MAADVGRGIVLKCGGVRAMTEAKQGLVASGLLQAFFTDRLMTQRRASPHTIAAYRDILRLLLEYVTAQTWAAPRRCRSATWTPPATPGS